MPKPTRHVFVCAQTRPPGHPRGSCGQLGCAAVLQTFAQRFERDQLFGRFALASTSCLGACDLGPTVLVYPDGILYARIQPADVDEIVSEHLEKGTPIQRLLAPAAVWS
jgi:(2Fe-2S) ferredoxin